MAIRNSTPHWGGKRENAGRTPLAEKIVRTSVALTTHRLEYLRNKYGDRNLSERIRFLVDLDIQADKLGIKMDELFLGDKQSDMAVVCDEIYEKSTTIKATVQEILDLLKKPHHAE